MSAQSPSTRGRRTGQEIFHLRISIWIWASLPDLSGVSLEKLGVPGNYGNLSTILSWPLSWWNEDSKKETDFTEVDLKVNKQTKPQQTATTTNLERSEKLISRVAKLYYLKHPSLNKNGMDRTKKVLSTHRKNSNQEKPPLSKPRHWPFSTNTLKQPLYIFLKDLRKLCL